MIHLGNEGQFELAYFDDAHLVETDGWGSSTLALRAYPEADAAKFAFFLEEDGRRRAVMFADEGTLREVREAITAALGEA